MSQPPNWIDENDPQTGPEMFPGPEMIPKLDPEWSQTRPEMIPDPKMIPKLDPKWSPAP